MPRHSSEYYEEREREYVPRRRGGRVAEYEDVEIRSSRREREPEFLRDDHGHSSAGPLVMREEEVIEERGSGRRRRRRDGGERHVEEEEVIVARSGRDRDRPRREVVEEEEVIVRGGRDSPRTKERGVEREEIREEVVYRPRDRERDRGERDIREREEIREEVVYRPRERERDRGEREEIREEVVYRPRERERDRGEREIREREEIVYRPRERSPPMLAREREEWHFGPRRGGREESFEREEITFRRDERERPREREFREEEITYRRDERDTGRPFERTVERDAIITLREDVSRERPRPRRSSFDREEITIRRDERELEPPRERERNKEEIIIRRERDRDSESDIVPVPPTPPQEPEPIRAPPIHQEIITHHRHIDHGFETRIPASAPPRARSPSPAKTTYDEIEIRRRGERNGQRYDDDIIIDTRRKGSLDRPVDRPRQRSASAGPRMRYRDDPVSEEADFYARRTNERAFMGEAYNGATKDWAIVDVPPGTNRVKMDGIGGGSQEITWQRYNGVRRSKFNADDSGSSAYGGEIEERGERSKRFVGQKSKTESMWTEITKDLVIKEAIEDCGYDYEETEFFFYVMEYLRYEDVLRLVDISEQLRRERRERIRQMEWERKMPDRVERVIEPEPPKRMLADRPYEEERFYEREVHYERPQPPPLPPLVVPMVPSRERREVKERVYVLR